MSDEMIAILVCTGFLAAMCVFSVQRRSAVRNLQSYGEMYQLAVKPGDEG